MPTLSDIEIISEIQAGRLVRNSDPDRARGACYELRLGNTYYDLTESDHPIKLAPNQNVLIKPGHRVVLITEEVLDVPLDILVRIVSKGSLFSVGLSAVATYADPGFSGKIGIVTQNVSDKYIVLPRLEAIAKADFTRLTSTAQHRYTGQHGYDTEIWPIKHHLQKSHADICADPRVGTEKEEGYRLLPEATANVLRMLEKRQLTTDIAIIIALMLNSTAVFLVGSKLLDSLNGLIISLVANLITTAIAFHLKRAK